MRLRGRIVFFVGRLTPNLIGVATTAVLTRLLDPSEYGAYALGLSIVLFLTMGVFEWLGLSLIRMAPTASEPPLFFGTVVTCFCVLCFASLSVAVLVLVVAGLQAYTLLTIACLSTAFAGAWFELQQRLQMSQLRERDYFRSSVCRSVVGFAFVCLSAFAFESAPLIIMSLAASYLVGTSLTTDSQLSFRNLRFARPFGGMLVQFGLPLSISMILATIMGGTVDKWLLQWMSGPRDVGMLTAATMVAQVPILALSGGVGPWAYSMAVQAHALSLEHCRSQLRENFLILIAIVLPAAAGIIAISTNLAGLMVGDAYRASVISLTPWLAAGAVLASLRAFYVDSAFQLAHRTSRLIWTMLVAVAVNIALCIWLIPELGVLGAALAIFGASVTGLVVTAVVSIDVFPLPIPVAGTMKIVASTAIMFVGLRSVAPYCTGTLALVFQIVLGLILYLGGALALDVMGVRDRLMCWLRFRLLEQQSLAPTSTSDN
jgi:O-antigen/teichoic acid export membrane protein